MTKQIIQFIQNHWMLCSASMLVLALLLFEEIRGKITGMPKISVQDTVLSLNREKAIVIDLRNQTAFSSGHILGAINIARADIDHNLKKLEPHKNQDLILVDDTENDVSSVGSKLQNSGFIKVYVLAGGLNSWKDAQLPLSKN